MPQAGTAHLRHCDARRHYHRLVIRHRHGRVQRQYTGTAGRIENSQFAVYLGYATDAGHAFVDRELYLPKSWTVDRASCQESGVPQEVEFATKPALARKMIVRALDAGVSAPWVTGDEVYGADPGLRGELEARHHHRARMAPNVN